MLVESAIPIILVVLENSVLIADDQIEISVAIKVDDGRCAIRARIGALERIPAT